jgi:hypothetical protein
VIGVGRARYPEDGHYPVWSCDLDPGDERFDESLALRVGAGAEDVVDVFGDLPEGGSWGHGRCRGDLGRELVSAGA